MYTVRSKLASLPVSPSAIRSPGLVSQLSVARTSANGKDSSSTRAAEMLDMLKRPFKRDRSEKVADDIGTIVSGSRQVSTIETCGSGSPTVVLFKPVNSMQS